MAFLKESMINRLSNLINRNRSAAKISQVLCSSTSVNIVDVVDVADLLGGNDGDPQPLWGPACGRRREL